MDWAFGVRLLIPRAKVDIVRIIRSPVWVLQKVVQSFTTQWDFSASIMHRSASELMDITLPKVYLFQSDHFDRNVSACITVIRIDTVKADSTLWGPIVNTVNRR